MNHARSDALRNAVGLVLFVIASPGLGQQNAHFQITPDSVLIDDRFRVALEGLEPRRRSPSASMAIAACGSRAPCSGATIAVTLKSPIRCG